MSRKKRRGRRLHGGFEGGAAGFEGGKRKRGSMRSVVLLGGGGGLAGRRRGRRRYRGFEGLGALPGRGLIQRAGGNLINTGVAVGAGVIGALGVNALPLKNAKIKAAIPLLAGILISSMMKNRFLQNAGVGLAVLGGAGLVRTFLPSMPVLSGIHEETLLGLLESDLSGASNLAALEDLRGLVSDDLSGVDDLTGEDLTGVDDLTGEDLTGVDDLTGEDLTGADLAGKRFLSQVNM